MNDEPSHIRGAIRRLSVLILAATTALTQQPASGQNGPLQLHGYAKNLAIQSSSVLSGDNLFLDISRLRLKGALDASRQLRVEVWLDTEALAGNFLESIEYDLSSTVERRTWLDLDWNVLTESRFVLQQKLFRAFVTYYGGSVTVTAGRQRIAWGTGFAWNPTDLFNPFDPAAIELDEKSGIDAVHVGVATGDFSRMEVGLAPGKSLSRASVAGRYSSKWGEYDWSLMGGYFRDDWAVGGDFAGYVGDAGLRGEAALTVPEEGDAYLRLTVTADRSFGNSYYGFIEYYFNGQGTRDKDDYDFLQVLSGRSFNVARDYAALSVSKTITPLLGAGLYSLFNIDDQSALFGPSVTYSVSNNGEIGAAVYVFAGKGDTEFGRQENAYFAYLQFFF